MPWFELSIFITIIIIIIIIVIIIVIMIIIVDIILNRALFLVLVYKGLIYIAPK